MSWLSVPIVTAILFVSVNRSFRPTCTVSELESCVERAWPISVAKASTCDRVVAVVNGEPIAAWRVRAIYATDETYRVSNDQTRPRIGISLGDPLPILPEYRQSVGLRRGVAVADCDVKALPDERKSSPEGDEG